MNISEKSNPNRPIYHAKHRDWKDDRDLLEEIAREVDKVDGPYDYYDTGVLKFRETIRSLREKGYEDNKQAYLLCQWIRKKLDELIAKHGSYRLEVHTLDFPDDFDELITQDEGLVDEDGHVEGISTANEAIGILGFDKIKDVISTSKAFGGKQLTKQNFSEDESDERDVHLLLSVCSGISELLDEDLPTDAPNLSEEEMGFLIEEVRSRNPKSSTQPNSSQRIAPSLPVTVSQSSTDNVSTLKALFFLCEQQLFFRNAEVEKFYDPETTDLWIPKWALGIEFRTTWEYDDELALMTTLSNTNFKLQARHLAVVVADDCSEDLFDNLRMMEKSQVFENLSILRIGELSKYLDRFENS